MKRKTFVQLRAIALAALFIFAMMTTAFATLDLDATSEIASGVFLEQKAENDSSGNAQRILTAQFKPDGQNTYIKAVYGGTLGVLSTVGDYMSYVKDTGANAVLAINGDKNSDYSVETRINEPVGLMISGGRVICATKDACTAIGFSANGTAVIGEAKVSVSMAYDGDTLSIHSINRLRSNTSDIFLYTSDYGTSVRTESNGTEVVLQITSGSLAVGGVLEATVVSVEESTKNTSIGSNQIVLTTRSSGSNGKALKGMKAGETVRISVSTASGGVNWSEAVEAMGVAGYLVKNGAVSSSSGTADARTCIGVKADGTVVFTVIDGKQSGYATGLGLKGAGEYMAQLGCTDAVYMASGKESTMSVIGSDGSVITANKPSSGEQLRVVNALVLVAPEVVPVAPDTGTPVPQDTPSLAPTGTDTPADPTGTDDPNTTPTEPSAGVGAQIGKAILYGLVVALGIAIIFTGGLILISRINAAKRKKARAMRKRNSPYAPMPDTRSQRQSTSQAVADAYDDDDDDDEYDEDDYDDYDEDDDEDVPPSHNPSSGGKRYI